MSEAKNGGGFIAISRSIFEHPVLTEPTRRLSRREAFEWLIAKAAWKPEGTRGPFGVAHVERGQLVSSCRELGKAWGWPKSNVARWLRRWCREGMISLITTQSGTTNGTSPRTPTFYRLTYISICNYEKFQAAAGRRQNKVGQAPGHGMGQASAQLSLSQEIFGAQQSNHLNHSLRVEATERWSEIPKPAHGATNGTVIWFDYGTKDWTLYAADYAEVRGAQIMPESRRGGRGNWFIKLGELHRKAKRA